MGKVSGQRSKGKHGVAPLAQCVTGWWGLNRFWKLRASRVLERTVLETLNPKPSRDTSWLLAEIRWTMWSLACLVRV